MGEASDYNAISHGKPTVWYLVFNTEIIRPWLAWMVPGQFKHVRAFGYVHETETWIFYDVHLGGTELFLARKDHAAGLIQRWSYRGSILKMHDKAAGTAVMFRFGFWCVPAIKHLIGLRSRALRPDRLWRDCLKAGASTVYEHSGRTQDPPRPDVPDLGKQRPGEHDGRHTVYH